MYIRREHTAACETVGQERLDELEPVDKCVVLEERDAGLGLVEEVEVDDQVIHQVRSDTGEVSNYWYTMRMEVICRSHARQQQDLRRAYREIRYCETNGVISYLR